MGQAHLRWEILLTEGNQCASNFGGIFRKHDNNIGSIIMEKIFLGKVGVDSGQLMITDPCYVNDFESNEFDDVRRYQHKETKDILQYEKDFIHYEQVIPKYKMTMNELNAKGIFEAMPLASNDDSYSYNGACHQTCYEENQGGELGNALGVAFSTHDDGCYSVYGYRNKDNRIMKVEIIMGEI